MPRSQVPPFPVDEDEDASVESGQHTLEPLQVFARTLDPYGTQALELQPHQHYLLNHCQFISSSRVPSPNVRRVDQSVL